MLKNKLFVWLIVAVIAIAAVFAGLKYFAPQAGLGTNVKTAAVTALDAAQSIKASGPLMAQSSAALTWKTSGTLQSVHVKVGQRVKAGDVLLSLETTSAPANIIAAQADLVGAKLALDNVKKSAMALAQAQQALAQAMKAVDDAQKDVDKLNYPRAKEDLIKQTQAQIDLAKKQVSRAEDTYKTVKDRPEGDSLRAQAELALVQARMYRDDRIRFLNWYMGMPDDIDAARYRAALAVAQAQQGDAQREVDRQKDGPNPDDIAAAQARVDAAQASVDMLSIIAPFDGEVLAIEQNPGDVVSAGMPAVTIADRSKLHVDALVDEGDMAGVAQGVPAVISMDAMPDEEFKGTVGFINPVAETIAGLVKYKVRVDLESAEGITLLGATADAVIQVSEARKVLAVPPAAVRSDKNGEYVTVMDPDGSSRRVDVQSGSTSGDLLVVTGNLQAGEQVALP